MCLLKLVCILQTVVIHIFDEVSWMLTEVAVFLHFSINPSHITRMASKSA